MPIPWKLSTCFAVAAVAAYTLSAARAKPAYLQVDLTAKDDWVGFLVIRGHGQDELCLAPTEYSDHPRKDGRVRHVPISLTREGINRIKLVLTAADADGIPPLAMSLTREPKGTGGSFVFAHENDVVFDNEGDDISSPNHASSEQTSPHLLAVLVTKNPKFARIAMLGGMETENDRVSINIYKRKGDRTPVFELRRLSIYDRMTRGAAVAFERKNEITMLTDPGTVYAIVAPQNVVSLKSWLAARGDGAKLLNSEVMSCGSPFGFLIVDVPPGLEFWYARHLQTSGLVATAYPAGLPKSPGWTSVIITDKQVVTAFNNPKLDFAKKDAALWAYLSKAIHAFALARRPGFDDQGRIARVMSMKNTFVVELTGRALSKCDPDRWEKINLQMVPVPSGISEVEVAIQMNEGFYAPGASPPSESRFNDNRLADSELEHLQELFAAYLLTHGLMPGDKVEFGSSENVGCLR